VDNILPSTSKKCSRFEFSKIVVKPTSRGELDYNFDDLGAKKLKASH